MSAAPRRSPRATTRRSHDERHEQIVDAALRIVARRGIAALTVAVLAEEVGVTGGALYRHFPSTDAILEAVAAHVAELLDGTLPDAALPAMERLERFVDARSDAASSRPGILRLMLSEQVALAMPPRAAARLRATVRKTWDAVESALADGQADGSVRNDIAAAALVPVIVGTVQVVARARAGELLPKRALASSSWQVLRALLSPPERRG